MEEKCASPMYKPPGMSSNVLIFHPGSRHLYFGRATDPKPHSIPHVIARRRKDESSQIHQDTLVPPFDKNLSQTVLNEVESCRRQLLETVQKLLLAKHGQKEDVGNPDPNNTSNVQPDVVFKSDHDQSLKGISTPNLIGEDVLKIPPGDSHFNIHCPWRRGQLNLHKGTGGSLSSVINDLEDIWRWCIENVLGIPSDNLNRYKAIVVIPVMFDRVHAKEIADLVIRRLGFQSAFLIQDHVCASFGCGVSCATVVDIGDQKISVSCIEDGVSYPQSRLELKFGGGDLTAVLYNSSNFLNDSKIQDTPNLILSI